MSQERLNGLAMLSIEKDMVPKLDYNSLITTFAAKNARRFASGPKKLRAGTDMQIRFFEESLQ
ncbi:hypothetical protein RHMOL_Rhmol03G0156000 [Rhododendron molle]|uniref:Uncharacterized protein n=1 Tax=Rhododendron molle TaxID=49168 RepID=A0ACC0PEG6_RHOML|nr:hypothetical protein RHMOL_Rhmol03G0156000 [Rhododendron molle]